MVKYHLLSIIWAIITSILILLPGSEMPDTGPLLGFDKVAHFIVFAVLSLFTTIGISKHKQAGKLKHNAILLALGCCIVYSLALESLQLVVPERQFDLLDIVANLAGISGGIIIFLIIYRL